MQLLRSSSVPFVAMPLALLVAGCSTPAASRTAAATLAPLVVVADDEAPPSDEGAKPQDETDIAGLARQLVLAQDRLRRAEADLSMREQALDVDRRLADAELELAKEKVVQFDADSKSRLAEAELELRESKDEATEAKEELEQIELMYAAQDLDDRTAEFVVNRGRRTAERSAARIAIGEAKLASLRDHQMPRERRELMLEVERQSVAIAKQVREGELSLMDARIQVLESRNEIERLQGEIKKAGAKADIEKK